MKKTIALLLIISLSLATCGCSAYEIADIIDSAVNESIDPRGTINGYVYTNELLGMSYRIDSNWFYHSDEDIKTYFNIDTENSEQTLDAPVVIYDMLATDAYRRNNISVVFEKANVMELSSLNMDDYLQEITITLITQMENAGYKNPESEIISIEIDGKTLNAIRLICEAYGVNAYQILLVQTCQDYLATITVTTFDTDTTADVLDNFTWIE